MANNRNANTGRFRYPNTAITPGGAKPEIKHLDLAEVTKPVAQTFHRDALSMQQGQQRQSPIGHVPSQTPMGPVTE